MSSSRKKLNRSLDKGDLLNNRFKLVKILGSDGISTVYKAIDRNRSEANKLHYVTIKVLKKQFQSTAEWRAALIQAVRKCKSLDHPNIAKIHGFYRAHGTVYLQMEYLRGESLAHKFRWGGGQIPVKQALRIVNEIGRALAYAHERGIVHDDLMPANVFLTNSGDVKVIDFGIAQALRRAGKNYANAPHFGPDNYSLATPSYASPEMLDLQKPDPRDDVYALACIAYELFAGRHPFGRVRATVAQDHGLELRPSEAFTAAQWSSLQKALAFDLNQRTKTVTEFITAFNASTKWKTRVSFAATIVLFTVTASLLYDKSQIPEKELPAEPEILQTSTLSERSDSNQIEISRVPDLKSDMMLEPTKEADPTADDERTLEQFQLASEEAQTTEGLTSLNEQEPRSIRPTSTAQDDTASLASVNTEPKTLTAQPSIDMRESKTDDSTPLQPSIIGRSTAAKLKKPASEISEFAAITEVAPKLTTEKNLPYTAQKQVIEAKRAEQEIKRLAAEARRAKQEIKRLAAETRRAEQEAKRLAAEAWRAKQETKRQAEMNAIKIAKTRTPAPLDTPTVAMLGPSVVINEFMASNDHTIADAQGGYDDWIELYNKSQEAVDLSGYYLSDNPKKLKKWQFPNGTTISARSYLIVWADRSSSYTNMTAKPPQIHTNFELSRRGEQILLVDSDENGNSILDRISFGRQREDLSMGRYPNGIGEFVLSRASTPGRANVTP